MDCYGGISKKRFWPGCSHRDVYWFTRLWIDHCVSYVPEIPLNFLMKNFIITDSSLEKCIPVHESFSTSNESFFKKTEKGFSYGSSALVIKCETRSVPVTTCANIPELAEDPFFVLLFPVPDALNKFAAPEIMSGNSLLLEQPTFNHSLCCYTGMIGAGHPEGKKSLHSLRPHKNILQGVI